MCRTAEKRFIGKMLSLVLVLSLCLGLLPARSLYAKEEGQEAAEEYTECIEINSVEDLLELSEKCYVDSWSEGKYIFLKSNLNLAGVEFKPIPVFSGTFDGGGHIISGFDYKGDSYATGFFRYIGKTGTVRNLKLQGSVDSENERECVGSVCGVNYGEVKDCTFQGTVSGRDTVGGIAGINESTATISGCAVRGRVTGYYSTGGIAGINHGAVNNCTNYAGINDDSEWVWQDDEMGGLGIFDSLASYDDVELYSGVDTGGIAGFSDGILSGCTNVGTVGYEHTGYNIGGIAGRQSGIISLCVNRGTVYGRKDVGGIAGQMEPFIEVREAESLRNAINKLHDLMEKTIDDMQNTKNLAKSDVDVMQAYVNGSIDMGDALVDQITDFADSNIDALNSLTGRMEYVMDMLPPVLDSISMAWDGLWDLNDTVRRLKDALDILGKLEDSQDKETNYERLALLSTVGGTLVSNVTSPDENTEVTVTVRADSGYRLKDGSVEVKDVHGNSISVTKQSDNEYTFIMPAENAVVSAEFAYRGTFLVKSTVGGSVLTSVDSDSETFRAAADNGYEFSCFYVDGSWYDGDYEGDDSNEITLSREAYLKDNASVVVEAVFVEKSGHIHKVKCVSSAGGAVRADKSSAEEGEEVTVTAAALQGYELDEITADGVTVRESSSDANKYIFTMPGHDVTVKVTYAAEVDGDAGVYLESAAGGSAYKTSGSSGRYTITIVPAEGYTLDSDSALEIMVAPGSSAEKEPGKTPEEGAGSGTEKEPGKTPQEDAGSGTEKEPEKIPEESAGSSTDKEPGKTPEEDAGSGTGKEPGNTPEEGAGSSADKEPEKTPPADAGSSADKELGKTPEEGAGSGTEKEPGKTPQEDAGSSVDREPEKTPEEDAGNSTENAGSSTEKEPGKIPAEGAGSSTEKIPEESAGSSTEKEPEKTPSSDAGSIADKEPGKTPEEDPGSSTDKGKDDMSSSETNGAAGEEKDSGQLPDEGSLVDLDEEVPDWESIRTVALSELTEENNIYKYVLDTKEFAEGNIKVYVNFTEEAGSGDTGGNGDTAEGGSNAGSHEITTASSTGGQVTASLKKAEEGEEVYVTPVSGRGYVLKYLTVVGSGEEIPVTKESDGKQYSFIMPAEEVKVLAQFEPIHIILVSNFSGGASCSGSADGMVTLRVKPDSGYALEKAPVVTDMDGSAIPISKKQSGSYVYEFDITEASAPCTVQICFMKQNHKQAVDTSRDDIMSAIDELEQASSDVEDTADRIRDITTNADGSVKSWDQLTQAERDELAREVIKLTESLGNVTASASSILSDCAEIYNILSPYVSEGLGDALDSLGAVTDNMQLIIDSLRAATDGVKEIVNYINAQPDVTFRKSDEAFRITKQAFHDQLKGLSDSIKVLNDHTDINTDILNDDFRAVNDQLNVVFNLLADRIVDVQELSIEELYEDVDIDDLDTITTGRVETCTNRGIVKGDINVGGIAGSMSIDDEDPEDSAAGKIEYEIGRRFITKCLVTDSVNEGYVTAKKDGAGGICGYMDHGIIVESKCFGSVESTEGGYVGGICGESFTIIKKCYALCSVSGGSNVGGIAGYADTLQDCYAMASVKAEKGRSGAIVGQITPYEEAGEAKVSGNYYVGRNIYGIDNISYVGVAEPISYNDLLTVEQIPLEFWHLKVVYRVEDTILGTQEVPYGASLDSLVYPRIPDKEGFYGVWPDVSGQIMEGTYVIQGQYKENVTVVTSSGGEEVNTTETVRVKPYALVEEMFTEDAVLNATLSSFAPPEEIEDRDNIVYEISIENSSIRENDRFAVRLLNPYKKAVVYGYKDGCWTEQESRVRGQYLQVEMTGTQEYFCVAEQTSQKKVIAAGIAAGAVTIFAALILLLRKMTAGRRGRKRRQESE